MRCEICQHEEFYQREGKILTSSMTFVGLDWLNESANRVVCPQCGYLHWFLSTD